jgi:hypothetical protein
MWRRKFCPGSFGIVIVVLREGGPYSRESAKLFITVNCVRNVIDDSVQHGGPTGEGRIEPQEISSYLTYY